MKEVHHAIVAEGEGDSGKDWVYTFIEEKLNMTTKANPDVHLIERDRFSVADARILKEQAYQTAFGSSQVFIIMCETVLREAQNALLKLFEEPAEGTHFILLVPNRHHLLPTVTSRLSYAGKIPKKLSELELAEQFLKGTISERVKLITPIVKDKDRKQARIFLDALEYTLHTDIHANTSALKEVAFVRTYIGDNASSLKMLLEHLAVTL